MNVLRQSATVGLLLVMAMTARAQVAQVASGLPAQEQTPSRYPKAPAKPGKAPAKVAVVPGKTVGKATGLAPAKVATAPAKAPVQAKSAAGGARPAAAPAKAVAMPATTPARRVVPTPAAVASAVGAKRTVIVIDPAHGGVDSGSQISDTTVEKNVTLALAFRLRSLLTARGFDVVMTRDADAPAVPNAAGSALTLDDRAGIANHAHGIACLVLHATKAGSGVHLYRSELEASRGIPLVVPWLSAQAAWMPQSQQLENQIAKAFSRSGLALVASSASVRPIDSMTCPALVVELAPSSDDANSINDTDYQQRVSLAIAGALLFWQNEVQPPARLTAADGSAPNDAAGVRR